MLERPMRFLTGHEIQEGIKEIVTCPGELKVAVAYWGQGSAGLTGLVAEGQTPVSPTAQILCDLSKGFCDPSEIRRLGQQPNICIKKLADLHAKVWINGETVLLGSANASMKALPSSDDPWAEKKLEIAVRFQDPQLSEQLEEWFEQRWNRATGISEEDLAAAQSKWDEWQEQRKHWKSAERNTQSKRENAWKDLKEGLVSQVVQTAKKLCSEGRFTEDLTYRALEQCRRNKQWQTDYDRFVGPDQLFKKQINPDFGKRICNEAEVAKKLSANGNAIRRSVPNGIIRTCTLFVELNPKSNNQE